MEDKIIEKELSYKLVGIFFEIQRELGRFCREKQYADVLENKLIKEKINFQREYPIEIEGIKSNFADFVVEGKILIDLKAKPFIRKEDFYQMKRYLETISFNLGLIVNFRDEYLKPKRVLNGKFISEKQFVDSDKKFAALNRSSGFTMVELMVAMGLFVIFMGVATAGFVRSLRSQKDITELMAINDNAGLALEQMSREMRTGSGFSKISETEIQFINSNNLTVLYRLNNGAIERGEDDASLGRIYKKITADNVKVNDFKIILMGNLAGDGYPPRITIGISISGTDRGTKDVFTNIQTTVSSRVLDT